MFKFIHAADIHLDSPLRGLNRYDEAPIEEIRGASRTALQNLVQLALKEEGVDCGTSIIKQKIRYPIDIYAILKPLFSVRCGLFLDLRDNVVQFISLYRQEGNPREQPLKNKGEYTEH